MFSHGDPYSSYFKDILLLWIWSEFTREGHNRLRSEFLTTNCTSYIGNCVATLISCLVRVINFDTEYVAR